MAALSLSIKRGRDGFLITDFTAGALAPNADDIEVRWNTTDLNGAGVTRKDVHNALLAFQRAFESDAMFVNPPGL
jgi:hypothetical protein